MDWRVPLWRAWSPLAAASGLRNQTTHPWPLLLMDFYESSDIFGTNMCIIPCKLFTQKSKEHPKCKSCTMALSRFCQYLAETCKWEATAEACFEINHSEITSSAMFGTKSGRNLTRSLCQTKNLFSQHHSAGLDCVSRSQLYFVRFRNGACKYFYVVVDFSLCNDERFRDLGGCSAYSGSSLQSVLSTILVF